MEKTFLLYLSVHWGDLIEQVKKICHIHFNIPMKVNCQQTAVKLTASKIGTHVVVSSVYTR